MNWQNSKFITSYNKFSQIPPAEKLEVAFSGRSNVGKSSLINKLLNRKALARVSSTPGKTVMVNFFDVDERVFLVDLPGYGYAKVSKTQREGWKALIEGYLKRAPGVRLVFQLVDFRHPPTADDLKMLDFLVAIGIEFVIVLTKADKLKKSQRDKRREEMLEQLTCPDSVKIIEFSAKTGEGITKLRQIIDEQLTNS
ncbi:MAG: ribosome biogenesis GTP-binding protein YihA/YsxC [Oscillospiraceae bacterium]|nr:ribosome biogenesis GTP-binding protein YihA/YsxC [Oscillospiraceae bacterium]